MVQQGIVLGHSISNKGIEVDKAKIDIISKLPPPMTTKGVRSLVYKFNCTRQLHELIVVMWLCKCEVEPTENRLCRKLTLKCLN
jgi:hypothetical protein